jgi:hypothetical protein
MGKVRNWYSVYIFNNTPRKNIKFGVGVGAGAGAASRYGSGSAILLFGTLYVILVSVPKFRAFSILTLYVAGEASKRSS